MITKLQIFVQIYTFMKIVQRMNLNYITNHYNWISTLNILHTFAYYVHLCAGKCVKIRDLMVVLRLTISNWIFSKINK